MTDVENLEEQNQAADRTMKNMDDLLEGFKKTSLETDYTNELDKQHNYVNSSLNRCRRCGDHCPTVLPSPPLSILCASCEAAIKEKEQLIWFADMFARVTKQGDSDESE